MALTKSTIPVLFKGGLDQRTSEKLVVPGKFLALENCVRRKEGGIQKRFGFDALSTSIFGTTNTLSAGSHLDIFEDDLIQLGNDKLYSYSATNDSWIDKGTCSSAQVALQSLVRNSGTQAMSDIAYHAGLTCTVYEDSAGGVRYSVYDDTTGAALVYNNSLDGSGVRPKVVSVLSGFVIGYITGSTLVTRYVAKATPTQISGVHTIAGTGVSSTAWDMDPCANYVVFAYNNSGSNVTIGIMTNLGIVGSPGTNGYAAPVATSLLGTAANCLTVTGDAANNRLWVAFHGSSGIVRLLAYTPDLATQGAATVETIASIRNVTALVQGADGKVRLYYEQSASSVKDHLVRVAVCSWDGSSAAITINTAAASFKRSVGLASKAFEVAGHQYVNVSHDSGLQPTYFTVRDDGFIISRVLGGLGGGHSQDASNTLKSGLPRVFVDSNGGYSTVVQIRNSLQIDGGGTILASNKGIEKAALDFNATLYGKALGRNYHIVGGSTLNYDGVAVTEHGFYIFPEDVSGAAAATGSLVAGAYAVRVIYEWTDGKGLIHRSAPSTQITTTVTLNQKINVTVPTLRVTNKVGTTVNIVAYIGVVNTTTTLYRAVTVANDPTADTVVIAITAVTPTNEILYTTGGILENIAPPAAKCIHAHKGRLFLGGTEDGLIYFTKAQVPQEGMAFQDVVPIRVDAEGGDVTAFGTLDSNLIIFKASRIYYESGEGPTDAGAQNDYFVPLKIASDTGTTEPRSVAEIPHGIIFKSNKGFALLSRRLGLSYFEEVADLNNLTVTSAIVLDKEQEVRFTTSDGVAIIYNYHFNQWSTFTNYEATSAVNALDTYLHLKANGTVNREVSGSYSDNGARITMGIETSWLAMAGIQGYQRVYKMLLLGDFLSHHFTKIKVAYDGESAYTETIFFNTQTGLVSTSVYGEGATYGSVTPYGGEGSSVYQFRIQPAQQKCQSFKLRIEDSDTIGSTAGGSFVLVALTLEVGRKYGAAKLSARKSVGNG